MLINFKYANLKILDGTGSPLTYTVLFGEGNLSYDEQKNREFILDRGNLATGAVRDGDDVPCSVQIEGQWTEQRAVSGGPVTLEEALKKVGAAAAWVSVGDVCEPYCVNLQFEYGAECAGTLGHRLTFGKFFYEQLSFDAKAGTMKISGKCKVVSPTIIRTAVS